MEGWCSCLRGCGEFLYLSSLLVYGKLEGLGDWVSNESREMAVGNTFGATALSSYGGFWLSFAIVLTPGGFDIVAAYTAPGSGANDFNNAFGFFLMGWFIFTTILVLCTLRSTVAFFLLFFFLDLAFLLLALARLYSVDGAFNIPLNKAGGYFGLFAGMAVPRAFSFPFPLPPKPSTRIVAVENRIR